MKHSQRVAAFKQIERLNNMRLASRRTLDDFCLKNKSYLDETLALLASEIGSLCSPRRNKPPKRWDELRPQDVERITKKLRYKEDIYGKLLGMGFVGPDLMALSNSIKEWRHRSCSGSRFSSFRFRCWVNREGTPQQRLEDLRKRFVRSLNHNRESTITQFEFIKDLHPDDVAWELDDDGNIHVTVANNIRSLNTLLPGRSILAARLYMEDLEVPVQVYHCARLHRTRYGYDQVQTCYIGRATLPRGGGIFVTEPYKTPTGAFKDAKAAWTKAMSAIIYTEEKE